MIIKVVTSSKSNEIPTEHRYSVSGAVICIIIHVHVATCSNGRGLLLVIWILLMAETRHYKPTLIRSHFMF